MVISKVYPEPNGEDYILHKDVDNLDADVLILVPDEQSLHELQGLLFLCNKNSVVHLLEPGTPMSWQGSFSPWHLNTDKYILSFEDDTPVYKERQ
ncbi:hypothetical protein [Enterococcus faecium]|uniref:Uncharacterized protein n=2 Tax=Gamaleyavirus TaxID=1920753 RepID=A0A385II44_9CAUD|nr:hypothetical protein [Enterococcus faecium]YP_010659715.1 hypothetical protein PP765_gp42 [Escherichia phage PGN829.1]YP_010659846.1 hypothetical protein PP766_gp89 [Escherichia phage U1G]AXY82576.1 hypothetical protein [Escherichia phage PGN829.1]MCH5412600.1 hypothetical protein [Enterococcus faecium]QHQ49121.1 hypothetical protein EI543_13495 [Enterococcus faecium]QXV71922.1 hypothetical protein [Escherichia phage U1G]